MAQQGGRIDFQIGFKTDKSGIEDLKKSLQQIQKIKPANFDGTKEDLREVKSVAADVESALTKAFNPNINSINLKTFDNELKTSKRSIDDIYASFSKAGAQGQVAFSQMARSVLTTNQQLKQTHSLINQMGTTMVNTVKWGIASSVMNTFTSSVQSAFKYVESLEKSLTNIRIVTGDSQEKMQQFAASANRAAQELGRSTMDYSKAALTFYQQGLDEDAVQARTQAVLKAQNITGAGSEMADYMTSVWNGYKVANEQAQLYVDKLAAVADSSASDMSQLAVAMSKVASTASTLGVDADQLNAQLATVIATTRQAPEAVGTAFKTIYTRMNDIKAGTDDAQISLGNYSGKMAELGFNVLDATGHLRDTGQVMQEIGSRWDTLTKEQQIYLATTMGGQRQVNQLIALFDNWTTYSELLNTSLESEGTLAQKNSVYLESLGAKMEQLGAAGERVKASLIDSESFGNVIDLLTTGTNLLGAFIQSIGGGGTALLGLGGIATQVFGGVISKEINTAITNFQNMRFNIEQGKKEMALTQQFGESQGYQQGAINEMLDAKRQMQEFYSVMSVEQRKSYNAIVEQIGAAKEQVILEQEKVDRAKEYERALTQAGKINKTDFQGQQDLIAEDIKTIITSIESLQQATSNADKLEYFDRMIDQVDQLKFSLGDLNDKDINKAFSNLEDLKQRREKLINDRNDVAVVDQFGQQEYDNYTKQIDAVEEKIQKAVINIKNAIQSVANLHIDMEVNEDNVTQAQKKLEDLKKTAAQVQQQMSQGLTVSNIVQGIGALGQATSALMAFGNSIKTIFDDSVPPAQKFFKVILSGSYAIPTLVTSIQKLNTITKAVSAATINATKIQAAKNAIQQAQVAVEKEAAAAKTANAAAAGGEAAATAGSTAATGADTVAKEADNAATTRLTIAQDALNAAMAANPIGLALAVMAGLVVAVAAATAAYDHFHMSTEQAGQAIDNFNQKAEQTKNTVKQYNSDLSNLDSAKDEWEKLSNRAGSYNSTIDNLTEDEKARYFELSNLIAQYNEGAVAGYDEQGNAIIANNDALKETIQLLKEKRRAQLDSTYDSEEFRNAEKGKQVLYDNAKDKKELNEGLLEDTTSHLTNQLQARGRSLTAAFETADKDTQEQLSAYNEQLTEILAGGAKQIFEKREQLIKIFEQFQDKGLLPADFTVASINELKTFNNSIKDIEGNISDAQKQIKNLERLNIQEITNILQTSNYDKYYSQLEAAGNQNINAIIAAYASGMDSVDENGIRLTSEAAAQKINDDFLSVFSETLGKVDEDTGVSIYQGFLDKIANDENLQKNNFSSLQEKNAYIKQQLENFFKENQDMLKGFEGASDKSKEAIQKLLANAFNIQDINIDFNTGKIESIANERMSALHDRIKEIVQNERGKGAAGLSNDIISSLLPSDIDEAQFDYIIENFERFYKKIGDAKKALEEVTSQSLTTSNLSQNLGTLGLASRQNQGQNLSQKQTDSLLQGLEQLGRIYPQLDQAANILAQDQLAGTAQYQAALQDVNNTLIQSTLHAIEMADDGGEAIKTAYTEGLSTAAQAIDAFEAGILTSGDKINESLAFTATKLSELDDLLGYGAISGETFGAALQSVSDTEAASYGLNIDEYQSYVNLLRATNEEYANNEFLARQVAIANERIAKGTEDLIDNWKDWNDAISDYINSGDDVLALADDWGELKEAIANTFNMQPEAVDMLGPNFVADNWDKIQQVKDGVEGAWEELDALMSQTLVLNAYGVADFSELDQNIQDAYNAIQELDGTNVSIVAGMEGTDDILNAFQTIADGAHWTSSEAQAAFSQMGYSVEVQEKPDAMHSQTEETQYYVPPTYTMESVPFTLGPFGTTGSISYPTISQEAHYESAGGGTKQSYEPGAYTIKSVTSNGKSSGGKISRKTVGNHGGGKSSGGKGGRGKKGKGGKGKKGKSSTPKTPKTQKSVKDTQDRYHDVNIKLKDIDNELSKVNKEQSKLTGPELLKNLEQQQKLLDKQVATYKEKLELEKQQRDQVRNRLAKQGVTFDPSGNISNYSTALSKALADYNAVIAKYNQMSAEDQQKNKNMLDNAKQKYETIKKDIQRYDKIVSEEIPGLEKSVQEAIDKQTEINIEKFKIKVDLQLDLSEAQREFNQFQNKVKKQLRDDDVLGQAKASFKNLSSYYKDGYDVIQSLTDQVRNTLTEINQIDSRGYSAVYGNNKAAALEDLKNYMKQLMNNLQDVEDIVNNIKNSIFDAIDKAQEAFDEQQKEYEQITDLIDHNKQVVQLLRGDDAYKELEKYYKLQQKNNNKELDFLRQQKDLWYSRMKEQEVRMKRLPEDSNEWKQANDRFKEYEKHWLDSLDSLNDKVEDAIENIIDKYTNAIDKAFDKLENKLTKNKGLENISEEWELINKQADMYLDQVNSMYEIDKLENAYRDAIKDNDGNLKAQKSLNNMMNEQLKFLRDKDKLTQYDVDRANALLQIEIKRLALQQQRQSKTKLRLRRDAQGNYTYQYTADEEASQQAQQELADAENSLYNMTKQAYKNNLDSYYDTVEDWQDKVKDVYKDTTLTVDQQQKKVAMLNEYYGDIINGLTQNNEDLKKYMMEDTFNEMAKMYDTNVDNFKAMTQAEKDIIMKDMVPYWKSGIQEMADVVAKSDGGFLPVTKNAFKELDNATKEYVNSLDDIQAAAQVNFDAVANGVDNNIAKTENLLDTNDKLIDGYDKELDRVQAVINEVQNLVDTYKLAKDEALEATNAAYKFIQADSKKTKTEANNNNYYGGSGSTGGSNGNSSSGSGNGTGSNGGSKTNNTSSASGNKTNSSNNQNMLFSGAGSKITNGTIFKVNDPEDQGILAGSAALQELKKKKNSNKFSVVDLKSGKISSYASGGYTGDWGNDGRLAILHQKELVLNKDDTQNILSAIQIVNHLDDILNSFKINTSEQTGLLNEFTRRSSEQGGIGQNIIINADFPAAKDHMQIEAAFDNLINRASQFAFKNKR